ncbi:hypothetical protein [Albimonas pacifica]|uniref:Flagellar protein FliL n=1 Tax=Albimonas pacifica TaxID=1114924 RepID=A0A1I3FR26_9RHOB|nr:hypothetical protein [Albimonas pacifica]SFI13675.1 hypothetical protein SAMN05216258_104458 [Albimonas pacifica]
MKKLIPVILALIGLGGGLFAGQMLRPPPEPEAGADPAAAASTEGGEPAAAGDHGGGGAAPAHSDGPPPPYDPDLQREYAKLDRQFIAPIVEHEEVAALLILTLSIEVDAGQTAVVFEREPKLRDRFLKVLFRHAQSGAFNGAFTAAPVMDDLRGSLLEAARSVLGPMAHDVLVTDIIRQDL